MTESDGRRHVVVIGAGPGGYPAAFRAAKLGFDVTLIDPEALPGGVCLYRGCIPSKALLHAAEVMRAASDADAMGMTFGAPRVDLDRLRAWKDEVVVKQTRGLASLSRARRVRHVQGRARFRDAQLLEVSGEQPQVIEFDAAIVATGSSPAAPEGLRSDSPLVMDSTAALAIAEVPDTLLVVGGGYIGLELGSVYAALGSEVTLVEMTPGLLPGVDRALVKPLASHMDAVLHEVLLDTRVAALRPTADRVEVELSGPSVGRPRRTFDRVLVAVGRTPNSGDLGLEHTAVQVDAKGFIQTDAQQRTAEPTILAVGDVAGEPMLAHKATHEGHVAAEAIAGKASAFDAQAIPAVVFTDPEIAWCGLTEDEAVARGLEVEVSRFPWLASGRAAMLGGNEGLTQLIVEPRTRLVLGAGIVGRGAGDLIGECVHAIEMGATADDLALSVHPHPTLSETIMEAAALLDDDSPHFMARRRARG